MTRFTFLVLLIFLSPISVSCQDFSFKLYFEDAIGNTDSLDFGYDDLATDTIDASFGEYNIQSTPLSTIFDVRFSDILSNGAQYSTFQSKKQIIKDHCPNWLQLNFGTSIELYSDNYPITVKWNSTLFSDTCRIGTILTDVHPGGWFDTQGTFRTFLVQSDSVKITKPLYYRKINNAEVGIMWISFMDSAVYDIPFDPIIFEPFPFGLQEFENSTIGFYPNPVKDFLYLKDYSNILSVEIYDLNGETALMLIESNFTMIPCDHFKSGIYLMKIQTRNGDFKSFKMIKE